MTDESSICFALCLILYDEIHDKQIISLPILRIHFRQRKSPYKTAIDLCHQCIESISHAETSSIPNVDLFSP